MSQQWAQTVGILNQMHALVSNLTPKIEIRFESIRHI